MQRRTFLTLSALAALSPLSALTQTSSRLFLYIGTYTGRTSEGIHGFHFDTESGAFTQAMVQKGLTNPSFLACDPQARTLFSVSETGQFEGQPGGGVSAFTRDAQTGHLTPLNHQPTQGGSPCYVSVDKSGRWLLTANYSSGNAAVFPILENGELGPIACLVQHKGSSVNPQRQTAPHAHCILLDAANRFAFVPDLGIDKVMIYAFDAETGQLQPAATPFFQTQPGAGPRHFTFHPNGQWAFVIQELNSTITALAYDSATGALSEIQTVPALPADFTGQSTCADIHVHPNGRFLYGSNRGHDSLVIYAINPETGRLTYVSHQSTQGKIPRNFAIDPSGTWLIAANQESDSLVSFRIDPQTGTLTPSGHTAEVSMPVCVKILGMRESHSN